MLSSQATYVDIIDAINKLADDIRDIKNTIGMVEKRIEEEKTQQQELILHKAGELTIAASKKVSREVFNKVMDHINTEVVPQVNAVVEQLSYATEQGDTIVDTYRIATHYKEQAKVAGLIVASDEQMARAPVQVIPGMVQFALPPAI